MYMQFQVCVSLCHVLCINALQVGMNVNDLYTRKNDFYTGKNDHVIYPW